MRECIYIVMMLLALNMMAQSNRTFEGEIVYEHFINTANIKMMTNTIEGVNIIHCIYKGDKLCIMEENSQSCTWIDYTAQTMTQYNPMLGWGYIQPLDEHDLSSNLFSQKDIILLPPGVKKLPSSMIDDLTMRVTKYTFAPTGDKQIIHGYPCHLFAGDINRQIINIESEHNVQVWVADQWDAPLSQHIMLMGLELDGLVIKRVVKNASQFNALNMGEISIYVEEEVRSIDVRDVKDDEVVVPSSFRIVSIKKNPHVATEYTNELTNILKVTGITERQKNAEPSFKLEGEWDF